MMAAGMIVLQVFVQFVAYALAMNNPYSLQPAVDALQRREAQLWRYNQQNRKFNYDDRQQVDEGAYDNDINDDQFVDERKRSMFRERGDGPTALQQSSFRERELTQPELAAQFLEAIDRERNLEREREQYKARLHSLWKKYQQQENDLEEDLFENGNQQQQAATDDYRYQYVPTPADDRKNERFANDEYDTSMLGRVADKRRLIMPWLPVSKRSFPMAKRSSPSYPISKADGSLSGTDDKVARDLQAIFSAGPMKSKRSSGPVAGQTDAPITTTTTTAATDVPVDKANAEEPKEVHTKQSLSQHKRDQGDHHDLDHDGYLEEHEAGHASKHRGHDHGHEGHDHDHEHDHELDHEHDHEHDQDDESSDGHAHDHDEEDDEESHELHDEAVGHDERKKKRATINVAAKRGNQEVLKEDQIIPGDLTDFKRKKSVEWSKYFGIDRRKKSTEWSAPVEKPKALEDYTPTHFRNHDQVVARPKLEVNEKKLDSMDQKLKTIEELIIDETMKFTAEHEGMSNPDDIRKLRDHVISRLATAYSLEKMRRALEKLKQSVDQERHLSQNELEASRQQIGESTEVDDAADALDKNKRVAIKKEKVEYHNNIHTIDTVTDNILNGNGIKSSRDEDFLSRTPDKKSSFVPMMGLHHDSHLHEPSANYNKRPSLYDTIAEQFTPIDEYTNNAIEDDDCPLLDTMEKRCRAINLLSGDVHQQFLPLCGVHQLCYLCGTSQSACDFQYMDEANSVCGNNQACQHAAQTALMVLRDSPGLQVGPNECMRNSCLKRALIDIGVV